MSGLPKELRDAIVAGCTAQKIDANDTLADVVELVGDDSYLDHMVWVGPAQSEPELVLDINVLGARALYNVAHYTNMTGRYVQFLEAIKGIMVVSLQKEHPPNQLRFEIGPDDQGIIYQSGDGLPALQTFRRNLIEARTALVEGRR